MHRPAAAGGAVELDDDKRTSNARINDIYIDILRIIDGTDVSVSSKHRNRLFTLPCIVLYSSIYTVFQKKHPLILLAIS